MTDNEEVGSTAEPTEDAELDVSDLTISELIELIEEAEAEISQRSGS